MRIGKSQYTTDILYMIFYEISNTKFFMRFFKYKIFKQNAWNFSQVPISVAKIYVTGSNGGRSHFLHLEKSYHFLHLDFFDFETFRF